MFATSNGRIYPSFMKMRMYDLDRVMLSTSLKLNLLTLPVSCSFSMIPSRSMLISRTR